MVLRSLPSTRVLAKRRTPNQLSGYQSKTLAISVILPVRNEEERLRKNLETLKQWKAVKEIIVIANGCTDNSEQIANHAGALVVSYPEPLGPDTGRAIGAKLASCEYILFLDADIVWKIEELQPLVQSLRQGADIALNRYPLKSSRYFHHPTAVAKRALNIALGMSHLQAASLTAVPHAVRKSAIQKIGAKFLAVPPLFQTKAVLAGLKITAPTYINVRIRNRRRATHRDGYHMQDVILGDHVEAFAEIIRQKGERGGYADRRRRDFIEESSSHDSHQWVAVVPASNEEKTLPEVIRELFKTKVSDIYVIENGSDDHTARVAEQNGAHVQSFTMPLGHDVGRAIGASLAQSSEGILFVDSDFAVPAEELVPFLEAIEAGADIALNDLSSGISTIAKRDAVTTMKSFLNLVLGCPHLGACSMTAVPHAIRGRVLNVISVEDLAVPPKAQVRAILSDLKIEPVRFVDVIQRNRYRAKLHSARHGSFLKHLIIGDHIEAISLLIHSRGERAGFVQPRRLDQI